MRYAVILVGAFLLSACASERELSGDPIVTGAWIRTAPPSAEVLAGYMTVSNPSNKNIRVIAASSEQFERVEFHRMRLNDGRMVMRQMAGIEAPAKNKARLHPGSDHLMLINPTASVLAGDIVSVDFILQSDDGNTSTMPVTFKVRNKAPY